MTRNLRAINYYGSEDVIGVWQYLIAATCGEIMALPLIAPGQDVRDLDTSPGGRLLISWCLQQASIPCNKLTGWCAKNAARNWANVWCDARRSQVATIAARIKHWSAFVADYRDLPNAHATWFIDPPYVDGGKKYPHNAIDYAHLATWSRERHGQVIVCEREGATWLPFDPLYDAPSARDRKGGSRCAEAVWLGGVP